MQRRPHATAVFSGIVLDLLIAATLIDVPDKTTLVIGAYGITIVSSTLFVAFDWRPHLMWLAVSLGVWLIAVPLAPIGDAARFQAVAVAAIALVTSAAGNRLVQKRRERTYATEATLRLEHRELRQTVARLEAAMKTIANLEGVLPICAHCKRIREGGHTWVRIETYVEQRSGAQFSHGICPECADRYFPGVLAAEPQLDSGGGLGLEHGGRCIDRRVECLGEQQRQHHGVGDAAIDAQRFDRGRQVRLGQIQERRSRHQAGAERLVWNVF